MCFRKVDETSDLQITISFLRPDQIDFPPHWTAFFIMDFNFFDLLAIDFPIFAKNQRASTATFHHADGKFHMRGFLDVLMLFRKYVG